jgi:DNA modification methylase
MMYEPEIVCQDVMDCLVPLEGKVDLLFADPPYNIGVRMGHQKTDIVPNYEEWTSSWVSAAASALRPGGSLWIACAQDWLRLFLNVVAADQSLEWRNLVVWHRQTPNYGAKRRLSQMWEPLIYCVRVGAAPAFNLGDVLVNSRQAGRKTDRWMKTNADVVASTKNPTDVWEISSAFHSRRQYQGFKGQKPEALLERVVLLSSNPGDLVVDPFLGSGTTAAVAKALGRRFVGCDIDDQCVAGSKRRCRAVGITL